MKIALAQIKPLKGDIQGNLSIHKYWINLAIREKADIILFPELSITGYEPGLAETLSLSANDGRLDELQILSNQHQLIIGLGIPLKTSKGIHIALLILHPRQTRQVYYKKYLHEDELPYFKAKTNETLLINRTKIAPAICYELSVISHFHAAKKNGAALYLATVAKTAKGMQAAHRRLSTLAKNHGLPTLIVNCIGPCDIFVGSGQSAVWDASGRLIGQLNSLKEGLLIYDSNTQNIRIAS